MHLLNLFIIEPSCLLLDALIFDWTCSILTVFLLFVITFDSCWLSVAANIILAMFYIIWKSCIVNACASIKSRYQCMITNIYWRQPYYVVRFNLIIRIYWYRTKSYFSLCVSHLASHNNNTTSVYNIDLNNNTPSLYTI